MALLQCLIIGFIWGLFNSYFAWVDLFWRNAALVLVFLMLWGTVQAYKLLVDFDRILEKR